MDAPLVGATAGEAVTAAGVAAAISGRRIQQGPVFLRNYSRSFLDSFQSDPCISLELLEKTVFPFASRRSLKYRMGSTSPKGPPVS
jgi:hypothetical protein